MGMEMNTCGRAVSFFWINHGFSTNQQWFLACKLNPVTLQLSKIFLKKFPFFKFQGYWYQYICYQSELRLLKSLILLRCRRPVIILALCNRVFNNSQLPTDYCHLYALLSPSVSLWAGSNVLFSPYSPFSGHSGLLYYQQPPRGKSYWNRCCNFFQNMYLST